MNRIFVISDTHFGHKKILDYEPSRKFKSIEEHDAIIIKNWNSTVSDGDYVIHLGDFGFPDYKKYIHKLNGNIIFVMGNHDANKFKYLWYMNGGFNFVCKQFTWNFMDKYIIFAHKPVDSDLLERFDYCICGHTHSKVDKDLRYINVSVENIKFTPILLEKIIIDRDKKIRRRKDYGKENRI